MSKTLKHTLARAFHKDLKLARHNANYASSCGALFDVYDNYDLGSITTSRYGNKRHYEAAMKTKNRRSDKFKENHLVNREIEMELLPGDKT